MPKVSASKSRFALVVAIMALDKVVGRVDGGLRSLANASDEVEGLFVRESNWQRISGGPAPAPKAKNYPNGHSCTNKIDCESKDCRKGDGTHPTCQTPSTPLPFPIGHSCVNNSDCASKDCHEGDGTPPTCASTACSSAGGRGCARVAVLLTAGFHNILHGMSSKFNGNDLVDAGHPLLAAWLRTTSLSLHRHIIDPNDADVFIYSWNPSLTDAFDRLYAPVRAAYARHAPLMRKIKRGALPGCKGCSPGSVSWAYTVREAEVLLSGHERTRGFAYDAVVFARPDVILFKDVSALELGADPRAVVMPSPNRTRTGDFFFMMRRRTAQTFATMYDVAANEPGCVVGCLDPASPRAVGTRWAQGHSGSDHQIWKAAFLMLRANATLISSKNGQPHDASPYRIFGVNCHFAKGGYRGVGARPELDAIGVDDHLLDLTQKSHKQKSNNHAFCPWLCAAFPNRTRIKCPTRQPPDLADSCCL